MKPMSLNMSKMRKIASDKKTSTFKHDDGHTMVIVHNALPTAMRKQIEKLPLAEGGDVLPKYMHPPKDPKMVAVPRLAMAEGGEASGPCMNPNCKSYGHVHPNCKCHGGYAKGGEVQTVCKAKGFHHPSCEMYADGGDVEPEAETTTRPDKGYGKVIMIEAEGGEINLDAPDTRTIPEGAKSIISDSEKQRADEKERYGKPLTDIKEMKMYADSQEPVSANDSAPVADVQQDGTVMAPAEVAPTPVNPAIALVRQNPLQGVAIPKQTSLRSNLNPDGTLNPSAAAENAQTANQMQKAVDIAAGQAKANQEAGYNQAVAANQQDAQQKLQDLSGHVKDFDAWMKQNPINPNHYVESMGTAGKVGTAIGLFLGGLGQVNGGNNPALDYLSRQIDRDIDAQKARSDQARTIYGAYRDLYGEGIAANNATKATMLDIYNHQAQLTAAKLGTPLAEANAAKLGVQIAIDKSKLLQDAAVSLSSLPGTRSANKSTGSTSGPSSPATPSTIKPAKGHGASGNFDHAEEPTNTGDRILVPNAESHFKNLAYTPKAREDLAAIQTQFNTAVQADKALGQIGDTFKKLSTETNGIPGRLHRSLNPHAIAAAAGAAGTGLGAILGSTVVPGVGAYPGALAGGTIGTAAGEGAGHLAQMATNTTANREYDSDKTALLGYVSAALKGTNIGSGQIQEIVDANSPEAGDTPDLISKKEKNIRDFIMNHTDTSLLRTWGLSHK